MTVESPSCDRLALILRKLDEASNSADRIGGLLSALADAGGPFVGAALFSAASEGVSFVMIASRGDLQALRRWKRWPLRRLFARMKPTRILDPTGSGSLALAIPLRYGARQNVVVAPLGAIRNSNESDSFFLALESVTVPEKDRESPISDEIPVTPTRARIAAFGLCYDLHNRIEAVLKRREWLLISQLRLSGLFTLVASDPPDVLIIDAAELADPVATLRTLHRVAPRNLRVLAFERAARVELAQPTLADCILSHDCSDTQIFARLKELVLGAATSVRRFERKAGRLHDRLATIDSQQELVQFASAAAASTMRGWAGIALVSELGAVALAEHPAREPAVLTKIPPSFLSDAPVFRVRVDEQFLDEFCDDAATRSAFCALRPISGAIMPIAHNHRRLGVLVAVSQQNSADSSAFERLSDLARAVGRRCDELDRAPTIPEFRREGLWERWSDRALEIAVYRSKDCLTPWRFRAVSATRWLLTIGLADDAQLYQRLGEAAEMGTADIARELAACIGGPDRFAALVDTASESISYASRDFSPPLLLHARGPSGALGTSARITTGTAAIGRSAEAIVCDRQLWRWFGQGGAVVEQLPALLETRTPPGFASMIKTNS